MKISEAFRDAGFWFRAGDYQFRLTTCPCGAPLDLDGCTMTERDGLTVYACPQCAKPAATATRCAGTSSERWSTSSYGRRVPSSRS